MSKCNTCGYLQECIDEGLILDVTQPHHDFPRYIPNVVNKCKLVDEYVKNILSTYPELKEELENPTGTIPVSEECRLAYDYWKRRNER